ncbi:DUF349 domain-containing protein [Clavibacter michiganensis subsp. michiganensis]|uniref:DUF349 domain-containing protein n=1 Tax=Clavibacter michiganensis TaxID=28447 RepID=UPI001D0A7CDD|nr:DUF349 domain-containing protein [Clavibacter michiganensis]UDM09529.1 DUF349 domain-containing protein [Clavibacter michiganensis subsp. michiganensis]WDD24217.1 DUF349 domain-containing protein [Clavibacter michiganensis subsp. michiganensis]WDD27327.1 DUF349 domain-containing protein [Clavibacter michiganensis subsp. michiganensis]
MADNDQTPWGRVDETGTVFLREGEGERAVGQYPDGTPEEALAYFQRKFTDLAGQVTLLEQRAKRGAPAADVSKAVAHLIEAVTGANAVGDLAALRARLDVLAATVGELTEKQGEEQRQVVQGAIAERTAIVEETERLATRDFSKVQWKQLTAEVDALFGRWQQHQQTGPRLPKNEANELWKRFRTARSTIDTERKAFFAELDNAHKDARSKKQAIVEQARALEPQGVGGIPAYRRLLDEWKLAGRAGKRYDDALWAQFKAAGDVLYGAKAEVDAADDEEQQANLQAKLALLDEAEPILQITERTAARDKLTAVQLRWDAIGRVPRDSVKTVEDRLRKVETHVRTLDEEFWRKNNPETKARSEGLASQLGAAIDKLQRELDAAKADGDARRIKDAEEALAARRVWLDALGS